MHWRWVQRTLQRRSAGRVGFDAGQQRRARHMNLSISAGVANCAASGITCRPLTLPDLICLSNRRAAAAAEQQRQAQQVSGICVAGSRRSGGARDRQRFRQPPGRDAQVCQQPGQVRGIGPQAQRLAQLVLHFAREIAHRRAALRSRCRPAV